MEPRKEISNWDERLIAIMSVLEFKSKADSASQITELFNLHNDRFLPFETGRSCGACRQRVYNKLKDYYLTNLKPTNNGLFEDTSKG